MGVIRALVAGETVDGRVEYFDGSLQPLGRLIFGWNEFFFDGDTRLDRARLKNFF